MLDFVYVLEINALLKQEKWDKNSYDSKKKNFRTCVIYGIFFHSSHQDELGSGSRAEGTAFKYILNFHYPD